MAVEARRRGMVIYHEPTYDVLLSRYSPEGNPDAQAKMAADDAGMDPEVYLVFEQVLMTRGRNYDPAVIWPIFLQEYDDLELDRFSDRSLLNIIASVLTILGYE